MLHHDPKFSRKCRRYGGRLRTEELTCSLGRVVDLSVSGMRVLTRMPWRRPAIVELRGYGRYVRVQCKVIRVRLRGLLAFEMGLRFLDRDMRLVRTLSALAKSHRECQPVRRRAA